jgi:acyl carrier protein
MSDTAPKNPEDVLRGFPPATVAACLAYRENGDPATLNTAITGIIEHLLPKRPDQPVASFPGSARLVEELGLDSFTMVEMTFIFEDVFGAPLPQDELIKVRTIDDLRALIQRSLPARK